MKNTLLCGIAILSISLATPTQTGFGITNPSSLYQSSAVWHRYRVSDAEFSVMLPVVPAMSSYSTRYVDLTKSPLRHLVGAYEDGIGYAIYVFDRKQSLDDFIAVFQPAAYQFKRAVKLDGVEGKEYEFSTANSRSLTQFFSTGGKLYVFRALRSALINSDERMLRFLASIRFSHQDNDQVLMDGPGESWVPPSDYQPGAATEILTGRVVSTKVLVSSKPEPTYTEAARNHEVMGTVVIRCVFRSSGIVSDLTVVSGLADGLNEQALAVARQIKFIPAIKDGHFVSAWMELQYNFNLY
jgi:TonB family protein